MIASIIVGIFYTELCGGYFLMQTNQVSDLAVAANSYKNGKADAILELSKTVSSNAFQCRTKGWKVYLPGYFLKQIIIHTQ